MKHAGGYSCPQYKLSRDQEQSIVFVFSMDLLMDFLMEPEMGDGNP
jgi:hypothetical protein